MPDFCDVAVPVPLDMVFTYRVLATLRPWLEAACWSLFASNVLTESLSGSTTASRQSPPKTCQPLDTAPVLDEPLHLARWIADYYLAPLGEVFRTMLPFMPSSNAASDIASPNRVTARCTWPEFRDPPHVPGAPRKSNAGISSPRLPDTDIFRRRRLWCGATLARQPGRSFSHAVPDGMIRKKWLSREDISAPQDAKRTIKIAI